MQHHQKSVEIDDDDRIIPDGQGIRVSMMALDSLDSVQRAVRDHFASVSDAVAEHNRYAAHRPGFVADALRYASHDSAREDASLDLLERRGVSLPQARAMRDSAFAEMEQRSRNAWRRDLNPDEHDDRERNDLESARAARQRAYEDLCYRGDNAWRTKPMRATEIEKQGERWRGGK